ncbi:hypothetical protein AS149_12920 [Burkholderia cenocepacia]|nr:hypothetical protein AS149_12920 [Burkholderia cenocepacia]
MPQAVHFDFDEAVRALYARDEHFRDALRAAFQTDNRKEVASRVFASPSAMNQLNDITREPLMKSLRMALAHKDVLVEFPLLFEMAGCASDIDFVIAVICDEGTQRARVAQRDHATPAQIDSVIASQFGLATKAAMADFVIDTSPGAQAMPEQFAKLMRAMRRGELRQRAKADFSDAVWKDLEHAYTESHRYYHGLNHIWSMFRDYDRLEELFSYPEVVRAAIWFHDFTYQVDLMAYPYNERMSANAVIDTYRRHSPKSLEALTQLEEGPPVGTVGLVAELILCTKGHKVDSPFLQRYPTLLADTKMFLDIDLAVLAAPAETCEQFDNNVRREFEAIPERAFALERAKVLSSFLARERIFFSAVFAEKEETARDNLRRLIDKWEAVAASSTLNAQAQ